MLSRSKGAFAGWNHLCITCRRIASTTTGCPANHEVVDYHSAKSHAPKRGAKKKEWTLFLRAVLKGSQLERALANLEK